MRSVPLASGNLTCSRIMTAAIVLFSKKTSPTPKHIQRRAYAEPRPAIHCCMMAPAGIALSELPAMWASNNTIDHAMTASSRALMMLKIASTHQSRRIEGGARTQHCFNVRSIVTTICIRLL